MQRYAISSPFVLFLLLAVVGNGVAATPALPAVELPTPIYFLTPGGDSVKIAPGSYQVEAADSWLKLFPAGQARSAAILLEANQGDHDEALSKPAVRLEADA